MRISSLLTLGLLALSATTHASIVLLQDFDGNGVVTGPGTSGTIFNQPSFSGSTSAKLDTSTYNSATISSEQSVSAPNSLKVAWQFLDGSLANNWVRLTSYGTNSNPVIDITGSVAFSALLMPAEPGMAVDPLGIGIGIREVSKPAGTPIGSNGGTSGTIEWVGVTGSEGGAPNPTRWLQPGVWTDLVFNPDLEPCLGFTGDGILSTASGLAVLEHIILRTPAESVPAGTKGKPYALYIDNVRAGGRNEIPEPATLSLIGLGLLPTIRRKR